MNAPSNTPSNAVPDASFWAGRRVLLTGHTGFKGSWLALMLERLGATVTGFALAPESGSVLHSMARLEDSRIGDLRDAAALGECFRAAAPDVVLHLAAQSLVRRSYRDPVETIETNVVGTMNVLQAVRATPSVRVVVVVTTDKCYLNREWHWGYREGESLGGRDPYSASKACAEIVAAAWRDSFLASGAEDGRDVRVATARAGNVIGGGDVAAERLVPDILRDVVAGRAITIRNPYAVRPWQHVLEPLIGYLLLAERLRGEDGRDFAEPWNFGPADEDAWPVGRIVDHLCAAWPGGGSWHHDGSPQPHEAGLLKLDSSKARARLGWRPAWRLEAALEDIVRWERARQSGEHPREASLATLDAHDAGRGAARALSDHSPQEEKR